MLELLAAAPFSTKDVPTVIIAVGFLVFVVVWSVTKLNPQRYTKPSCPVLTPEIKKQIGDIHGRVRKLYCDHDIHDQDGVPLWYVPRKWGQNQEEMLEALRGIASDQRRVADTIEKMVS
jgi:hypothetical protein